MIRPVPPLSSSAVPWSLGVPGVLPVLTRRGGLGAGSVWQLRRAHLPESRVLVLVTSLEPSVPDPASSLCFSERPTGRGDALIKSRGPSRSGSPPG